MKILFFFVHPAKYYLFKHTINTLQKEGVYVDVAIISKEVLEELVKVENWNVINIFPCGRKYKYFPIIVNTIYFFFLTLIKLFKLSFKEKYDVFITDDCLTLIGKVRRIPSIFFIDNEPDTIPGINLLINSATKVLVPNAIRPKIAKKNIVSFEGYKELAYLHPKYFSPNKEIVRKYLNIDKPFVIIRMVSFHASHDINKKGISNKVLKQLIDELTPYVAIYLSAERKISDDFDSLRLKIDPLDIHHLLYYANFIISDSGTMTSEAAILGTPAIFYSDFVGKLTVIDEKEYKYNLIYLIKSGEVEKLMSCINGLLAKKELKKEWIIKRNKMLKQTDDLNEIILKSIYDIKYC